MSAAPRATAFLGPGCATGPGSRGQLGMRELQGLSRRLTLGAAEPGSGAFLMLGLAAASTGPVRLTGLGLPQCAVHPAIQDVGFFVTDATGYARHDSSIPEAATFGSGIDAQWVTLDARAGVAGLSEAIRFAIWP